MPRSNATKALIVDAATQLFVSGDVASTSISNVCARVGVTKKTFYYHFSSKDELLAAVVIGLRPYFDAAFDLWVSEAGPNASAHNRILAVFIALARETKGPTWRGYSMLRIAVELSNVPGHPARKLAVDSNLYLASRFEADLVHEGIVNAREVAAYLLMLLNGMIVSMIIHRDQKYLEQLLATVGSMVPERLVASVASNMGMTRSP